MNTKNLITRSLAGIVYIGIILCAVLGGKTAFVVIFGLILCLALFEFYRLTCGDKASIAYKVFNIVWGILLFLSTFLMADQICAYALPFCAVAYLLALLTHTILSRSAQNEGFNMMMYALFGQVYITFPLSLFLIIAYKNPTGGEFNSRFLLAAFIFIWVCDTAAYLVGSTMGKHKLLERLSPKKTIEGFGGGIVFTMIASIIFSHFHPELPLAFWIVFALITALFGTLGDLFESLIKRIFNTKDSGNIIPGHGGILDRIDSLLMVIPAIYLLLTIYALF